MQAYKNIWYSLFVNIIFTPETVTEMTHKENFRAVVAKPQPDVLNLYYFFFLKRFLILSGMTWKSDLPSDAGNGILRAPLREKFV